MPSNASVLQDNNYYQDFSYVIKSPIDIESYKDTITEMAHPAGFKMFGSLSIDNEFESNTTIGSAGVSVGVIVGQTIPEESRPVGSSLIAAVTIAASLSVVV